MTPKEKHTSPCAIDCDTGAMALIDILYEMEVINRATYENIKRNARK